MKRFIDLITISLSLFIIAAASVGSQEDEIKPKSLNQTILVSQTASK